MKGALFGAHNNESSLACRRSSSRYLFEPVAINRAPSIPSLARTIRRALAVVLNAGDCYIDENRTRKGPF
jgi:hypothetical protein